MRWWTRWLRGGSDELGWDDVVRRVVRAVAELAHYADRGAVVFPPDVRVKIEVGEGSVEVIRRFVDDPKLDREVGAALANTCDCGLDALPIREYRVEAGERTRVEAVEGPKRVFRVTIEGGDRSGEEMTLPRGRGDVRFGRGEWHGPGRHLRNDLVICEETEFVSRRAGRWTIAGARLEVESLDQGDSLLVRRPSGETICPARTAKGRVALGEGDAIEITGPDDQRVCLRIGRIAAEDGPS